MTQKIAEEKSEDTPEVGNFLRRNNRGCKSEDFYNWPEQPLDDMDSPLAVQQYIQQLIRRDPADIDEILKCPEAQDLGAWKIEHLRIFCMQLNRIATKLQECCFPEVCNQMTATEQWIFLCAAHRQPNECTAIDYTRHTLDGAANLLNSNKYFPSRVTIKETSISKLGSVCRRVYRIFSHAYYHHFQLFDEFERETHLCKRFTKFVTNYDLIAKDSLIVPADGSKPETSPPRASQDAASRSADEPQVETADDSPNSQDTIKSDDDAKIATQVKLEPEVKKVNEEANTKPQPSTPKWSASQVSTNTMVKGASLSSYQENEENDVDTLDGDTSSVSLNSSKTVPVRGAASAKNGVESEA